MSDIITLTQLEMFLASHMATHRRLGALFGNQKPRYAAPEKLGAYEKDFFAAQGELAVAKGFNLYPVAFGGQGFVDVGGLIEVRSRPEDWHELIVHPPDADDYPYVLPLCHKAPTFELAGWMWGKEAKQSKWWKEHVPGRPAYFVPQDALRPMADLHALVDRVWSASEPPKKGSHPFDKVREPAT